MATTTANHDSSTLRPGSSHSSTSVKAATSGEDRYTERPTPYSAATRAACRRSSPAAALGSWKLGAFNLHQAVVESRAAPEVGDALRGEVVRVAPVGGVLLPPHRGR